MPTQTWTLLDNDQDIYVDNITLAPEQVGGAAKGYSVVKRTLCTGLSQGVDVIEVRNGEFRFTVLPTRGMGIWRASLGDLLLGWKSPVRGPVHPAYVRTEHPDGIGWLDGFDELLVRCGLESNGGSGVSAPTAGFMMACMAKIANIPANKVELEISMAIGAELPFAALPMRRTFSAK